MELEDFEILCDTLLVNNSELERISILELLANEQLLSLIKNIIKNEKILHKISRKSYIHNNGFIKIVLIDKRPHYAIRLHIWPNTEINNTSAHNHPWDITVKIISGEYEWINCSIYNLGNKNALLYNCIYYNNYNSHKIIFLKNVKLNQDEIISYKKGDIFDYSKNIYHTIKKVNKNYVDSLVICGETHQPTANIVSYNDITSLSGNNKYIDSNHLKYILIELIERNSYVNQQ